MKETELFLPHLVICIYNSHVVLKLKACHKLYACVKPVVSPSQDPLVGGSFEFDPALFLLCEMYDIFIHV